jgi:hypothetical protein
MGEAHRLTWTRRLTIQSRARHGRTNSPVHSPGTPAHVMHQPTKHFIHARVASLGNTKEQRSKAQRSVSYRIAPLRWLLNRMSLASGHQRIMVAARGALVMMVLGKVE